MSTDPDCEWEFIDGSYVKAHQHSGGAADKEPQAIGKSRAGNITKIHLVVDSYGLPAEYKEHGRKRPSFRRAVVAQTSLPFHPSL